MGVKGLGSSVSAGERDASKRETKSGLKVEEGLFSVVFCLFNITGEW